KNISSAAKNISIRLINADASLPLLKFTRDDYAQVTWVPFGPVESFNLAPGLETLFRLAVRRADMTTEQVSALLEVSDGAGMLYRVPLSVEKGGM
ncbi:MAG: hypothetical protein C0402_09055, partial [Thermodesulfovibrio sp.]|nr:hypothetical protein [Thermodesulfovibrio sp.]